MAVYTEVSDAALAEFLSAYAIGSLLSFKGIAEGVENSNFFLHTTEGAYILTLYEKRVREQDLPFFIGLMEHLSARGLACPQPVRDRAGQALGQLCGRPAAIVSFLEGVSVKAPGAEHCRELGRALAELHAAGRDFPMVRENNLSVSAWRPLFAQAEAQADSVEPGLAARTRSDLAVLEAHWPRDLPGGVIHADLFTDNVFFIGDALSGLIDFYFACTDAFAYDLAGLPERVVLRPRRHLPPGHGRRADRRLRGRAAPGGRRGRGPADPVPGRRPPLHAHPAGRLAERAPGRPGEAEGPAGIRSPAHLPPPGAGRPRLRAGGLRRG